MTELVEVKTQDLLGAALDWAVAKAEGVAVVTDPNSPSCRQMVEDADSINGWYCYSPSTDWSQGGPLIEKYKVMITPPNDLVHRNFGPFDPRNGWCESGHWGSTIFGKERKYRRAAFSHPDSPLIVAMRAIIQFELGDTVSVPKELLS